MRTASWPHLVGGALVCAFLLVGRLRRTSRRDYYYANEHTEIVVGAGPSGGNCELPRTSVCLLVWRDVSTISESTGANRPQVEYAGTVLAETLDLAQPQSSSRRRLHGVDALKGLLVILVVLWHTQGITVVLPTTPTWFQRAVDLAVAGIYVEITLLAVPTFLLVSIWLYVLRRDGSAAYLRRRLLRLASLFLVWSVIQTAIALLIEGRDVRLEVGDLFTGGPPLPIVGGSVLYFLSNLMLLLCVAEGLMRLTRELRRRLSIGMLCVLGVTYAVAFAARLFHRILVAALIPCGTAARRAVGRRRLEDRPQRVAMVGSRVGRNDRHRPARRGMWDCGASLRTR